MITLGCCGRRVLISMALLGATACARTVVENPSQPISQYKLRHTQAGVELGIDPVVDQIRLERYFVRDLLREFRIVAVFVVMRNDGDAPILVQNGGFALIDVNGRPLAQSAPISAALPAIQKHTDRAKLAGILCVPSMVSLNILSIMICLAATSEVTSARAYQDAIQSIFERSLQDRVVLKGESHSGFVYFGLQEQEMLRSIRGLRAELKATTTDQPVVLTVELDLSEGGATDDQGAKSQ